MQQKQLTTIVTAVLVSVGILGFAIHSEFFSDGKSAKLTDEQLALSENITDLDTDGDGLKNWEEVLWKTDPAIPDTDRDGINDNDEILQGRDPAVFGEGDLVSGPVTIAVNEAGEEEAVSVDYLAADLLVEYAALKQDGLSPEAEQDILNELIVGSTQGLAIEPYTEDDFIVAQNQTSRESLDVYFDSILEALSSVENIGAYEIQVVLNSVQNNSPEDLVQVDSATAIHDTVLRKLLAIEVPQELLSEHVAFTNNLHVLNETLKNVRQVNENPILALASLQAYVEIEPVFLTSSEELGTAFGTLYSSYQ